MATPEDNRELNGGLLMGGAVLLIVCLAATITSCQRAAKAEATASTLSAELEQCEQGEQGEHSVVVLPPETEERIKAIELDVARFREDEQAKRNVMGATIADIDRRLKASEVEIAELKKQAHTHKPNGGKPCEKKP